MHSAFEFIPSDLPVHLTRQPPSNRMAAKVTFLKVRAMCRTRWSAGASGGRGRRRCVFTAPPRAQAL